MTQPTFDVAGFGALNHDHILNLGNNSGRSDTEGIGSVEGPLERWEAGGSAANSIFGLGKLGLKTAFIGAIGDDAAAEALLESFSSVGVDTDWIIRKDGPSGIAVCVINSDGREIQVYSNANHLYTNDDLSQAEAALHNSKIVHLSSFADSEQLDLQIHLAGQVSDKQKLSLSPGGLYVAHGIDRIAPLLQRADYIFMNVAEIVSLMDAWERDFEGAVREFKTAFPRCEAIIVTLGAGHCADEYDVIAGEPVFKQPTILDYVDNLTKWDMNYGIASVVFDRSNRPIRVRAGSLGGYVVDTTGAGDAYAAGFLCGVIERKPMQVAAVMGRLVADRAIQCFGARTGLPTRPELQIELDLLAKPPLQTEHSLIVG